MFELFNLAILIMYYLIESNFFYLLFLSDFLCLLINCFTHLVRVKLLSGQIVPVVIRNALASHQSDSHDACI
jgi:hypothetical protein